MLFDWKNRQISERARSAAAAFTCLASLGVIACGPADSPPGGSSGAAGMGTAFGGAAASSGGVPGGGAPSAGTVGASGSNTVGQGGTVSMPGAGSGGGIPVGGQPVGGNGNGAGGSSGAGLGGFPQGGNAGSGAGAGGGVAPGGGAGGSAGAAQGGATHMRDHCVDGYDPDPSDATMKSDGVSPFSKNGQTDTTVQPEVISWMQAHVWEQAHFQWHNIRRCTNGQATNAKEGGGVNPCKTNPELIPTNQEGKGAGDGLEFLAMHRHMIQSLKQLWPKHAAQFEGWDKFPTSTSDVPAEWQDVALSWPQNISQAAAKADDPASHMSEQGFESEGAFGQWIQTTSGLHGALHFKWVRTKNDEHGLGNQYFNIDNYMFWKMHGWIDKVWDKYRAAKGKKPTDQDIKDAVLAQCRQMDQLALIVKPDLNPGTGCTTPPPKQTGVFEEKIRPMFESATNKCTGCHGSGPAANLKLGGDECLKSSDIVAALVNKPSTTGGQFKLVVPNDPEHSWLYLKVSGGAANAGCVKTNGVECNTDLMPQGGGMMSQADIDALKQWIMDGAKAPQ